MFGHAYNTCTVCEMLFIFLFRDKVEILTPPSNSVPGQRVYVEGYDQQGGHQLEVKKSITTQ